MNCCFKPNNKTRAPSSSSFEQKKQDVVFTENKNQKIKHEVLLKIPGCKVHLMEGGEAIELANGDFTLARISDENVSVATTVSVGHDHGDEELLQWPLTKDEPVVKLDSLHYLFSLPLKDGDPLSYGITFLDPNLGDLDSFLKTHALFSVSNSSKKKDIQWKEFAPRIDDYNNVLAKAIAGGTGQIVKGIFKCSNAYTNQVLKGGETILISQAEVKYGAASIESKRSSSSSNGSIKKNGVNKSLKRY